MKRQSRKLSRQQARAQARAYVKDLARRSQTPRGLFARLRSLFV